MKSKLLIVSIIFPQIASADTQIVSCSGLDCNTCHFIETLSRIIKFLLQISASVAVLFLLISGLIFIGNLGKNKYLKKAKSGFFYSLYGFAFILVSFVAINAFIWVLGGKNLNHWYEFNCSLNNLNTAQKSESNSTYYKEEKPIVYKFRNVSDLVTSDRKIGFLDTELLEKSNLRQDLLSMGSGERITFVAAVSGITPSQSVAYMEADNGYTDNNINSDSLGDQIKKLFTVKKDDGDLTIDSNNIDNTLGSEDEIDSIKKTSGIYSVEDGNINSLLDVLIAFLQAKIKNGSMYSVIAYKTAQTNQTDSLEKCIDSNGDWIEFRNECLSRKQIPGKENVHCSDVSNPTMGCQCADSQSLISGYCTDKNSIGKNSSQNKNANKNDESSINNDDYSDSSYKKPTQSDKDGDGVDDSVDKCLNSPMPESVNKDSSSQYYGCSCSQMPLIERTCPATRCEGSNLVEYPSSGKDTCSNAVVTKYSCDPTLPKYNKNCDDMNKATTDAEKQQIAQRDQDFYNKIKDYLNRSKSGSNPDNWGRTGSSGGGSGSSGGGGSSSSSGGGSSSGGSSSSSGGGKDRSTSDNTSGQTGNQNSTGQIPPDQGQGNFNPTPTFDNLTQCLGFKDNKIPYNGVIVLMKNASDPNNANHPSSNASRLFYLDRNGKVYGNAGNEVQNSLQGGLKAGPWTKGSGGTAWNNGWDYFNAQTIHTNSSGNSDPYSFRSGQGVRSGPKGEGISSSGQILGPNDKLGNMSGCNMHSGDRRSHSRGCMTMGGQERKGFTQLVKQRATQDGGRIMMAVITAQDSGDASGQIQSQQCGNMDPNAAINRFKQYDRNFDPYQGYSS